MSFRYRKRVELMPGVGLNLNAHSVSVSLGVPGAHYTIGSSGRRTRSVGIPGTGVSWRQTTYQHPTRAAGSGSGARIGHSHPAARAAAPVSHLGQHQPSHVTEAAVGAGVAMAAGAAAEASAAAGESAPPDASLLASLPEPGHLRVPGEKEFHGALVAAMSGQSASGWVATLDALATSHPTMSLACHTAAGLLAYASAPELAIPRLEASYATGKECSKDPLIRQYLGHVHLVVLIVGQEVVINVSRELVGVLLAILFQQADDHDSAIAVAEELPDSEVRRVLEAISFSRQKRYTDQLTATADVPVVDELSAAIAALHAEALREAGHPADAVAVCSQALAVADRAGEIHLSLLVERAHAEAQSGDLAAARADIDAVRALDPYAEGLAEAIGALGQAQAYGRYDDSPG
jgi:Protein of unknown function (DUF4236)